MIFWLAFRRLLPLLAVVSLAFVPVAAPAAMCGMHAPVAVQRHQMEMPGMDMGDMPCCPRETPTMPDCSKGCPLMALCLAKVVLGVPSEIGLPVRVAIIEGVLWSGDAPFDSLAQAPPPEPPRS